MCVRRCFPLDYDTIIPHELKIVNLEFALLEIFFYSIFIADKVPHFAAPC